MNRLPRTAIALLAICAAGLSACETETLWIDPPVNYTVDHRTCGDDEAGTVSAETGIYEEQIYNPFSVHKEAPISKGNQGGTWLMPALRTTGIHNPVRLRATITSESGEQIGVAVIASIRLKVSPDEACEIQALPISVQPIAKLNDKQMEVWLKKLYGTKVTLRIDVESKVEGGGKATGEVEVTLVKG